MFKQFLVLLALLAVSNAALRGAEAPEDTIQRSGGTEVGGVPATVSTTPVEKETAGGCGCLLTRLEELARMWQSYSSAPTSFMLTLT